MGPNGPKLQIREKNGHFYPYINSSRIIDGKRRRSTNVSEGHSNEVGEEYAGMRAEMDPFMDFSKIGSRNFGASHLLYCIQGNMPRIGPSRILRHLRMGDNDLRDGIDHQSRTRPAGFIGIAIWNRTHGMNRL